MQNWGGTPFSTIALLVIGVFLLPDLCAGDQILCPDLKLARSEPFSAAALQAAAGPPIPQGIRPVQGALCSRGTGTARQSPVCGPRCPAISWCLPSVKYWTGTGP